MTRRTLREIELDGNSILREIFGVEERDIEKIMLDLVDEGVIECHIIDGIRYYSSGKQQEKAGEENAAAQNMLA